MQRELDPSDRAVLDSYLTAVREVERRIEQRAAAGFVGTSSCLRCPIGALDSFEEQVKLMFDLIALAYRADLTRVVSFMMVVGRNEPNL